MVFCDVVLHVLDDFEKGAQLGGLILLDRTGIMVILKERRQKLWQCLQ